MPGQLFILAFASGVVLLWMFVPLVIAGVIYKLSPNKTLSAKGPFQGLNIKVTGPFVIYLLVLLGSAPIWWKTFDVTIGTMKTRWTVTAPIMLIDHAKNKVAADSSGRSLERLRVKFDFPQVVVSGYDRMTVQVPGAIREWPDLVLEVPNFGEKILYLNDLSKGAAKIDYATATVELDEVIVITERSREAIGVGMGPAR